MIVRDQRKTLIESESSNTQVRVATPPPKKMAVHASPNKKAVNRSAPKKVASPSPGKMVVNPSLTKRDELRSPKFIKTQVTGTDRKGENVVDEDDVEDRCKKFWDKFIKTDMAKAAKKDQQLTLTQHAIYRYINAKNQAPTGHLQHLQGEDSLLDGG